MDTYVGTRCSEARRAEPYVRCRYSPQRTLALRFRVALGQADGAVRAALDRLLDRLRAQHAAPAGAPFIAYHAFAPDHLDLEVGVPVPEGVLGDVEVHVGMLPMGRFLTVVERGQQPEVADADRALERWLALNREKADGPLYVSAGQDMSPADVAPAPCVFMERRIRAGDSYRPPRPDREAEPPNELVARASSSIIPLLFGAEGAGTAVESSTPARPAAAGAGQARLEKRGDMHVEEVMTRDVRACSRGQSLQQAAKLMWDHDIGAVPVIDEERRPIGMITDRDIAMAAYTQGRPLAAISVASAMSQRIFVCRAQDLIGAAEQTMASNQVRRLPVVSEQGTLVGMLSLNDIVLARTRSPLRSAAERLLGDVVQTLAAISQHRRGAQSGTAPSKRAPQQVSQQLATGGTP